MKKFNICSASFDLPIVIMAGGKGLRLRPLTDAVPKPLIPFGNKTIIEEIMDKFVACGSNNFYISLNYKADFIRDYFLHWKSTKYNINYFQEDKPLGTAGSLSLLKNEVKSTFFVSNCDIIINEDYSRILSYHKDNQNELTLITTVKTFSIPYGIVETSLNGLLKTINEKPEFSFQINTGMYILEPHLIDDIPYNKYYHITHLIEKIISRGGNVGCFPISESSWLDLGNIDEYLKLLKK